MITELLVYEYVKLSGERDNVMQLMGEADVFVLPSRFESLLIAMIEAMACGLSLIVSNVPGLRDCVSHEKNRLLFEAGDPDALANCLIRLSKDQNLREVLAQNARKSFDMEYNMHTNIQPLKELILYYACRKIY